MCIPKPSSADLRARPGRPSLRNPAMGTSSPWTVLLCNRWMVSSPVPRAEICAAPRALVADRPTTPGMLSTVPGVGVAIDDDPAGIRGLRRSGRGQSSCASIETRSRIFRAVHGAAIEQARGEPVLTAQLASVLKSMALDGRGVAWLPATLIRDDVAAGRLMHAGSGRGTSRRKFDCSAARPPCRAPRGLFGRRLPQPRLITEGSVRASVFEVRHCCKRR